jgi:hypothetical protein
MYGLVCPPQLYSGQFSPLIVVAQTTLHRHNSWSPLSLLMWHNVLLTTSHYTLMQLVFSSLPLKKYIGEGGGKEELSCTNKYLIHPT